MFEKDTTKIVLAFTFRMSLSIISETKVVLAGSLVEANAIAAKAGIDTQVAVLENVAPLSRLYYMVITLSQDKTLGDTLSEDDKDLLAGVVNPEYINDGFAVGGGIRNEPGENPFHVDLLCMGTALDSKGTYVFMSAGLNSDGYRPHPLNRLYLVNTKTGNRIEIYLGKDF